MPDTWDEVPNHEWYDMEDHGTPEAAPDVLATDYEDWFVAWSRDPENYDFPTLREAFHAGYEVGVADVLEAPEEF